MDMLMQTSTQKNKQIEKLSKSQRVALRGMFERQKIMQISVKQPSDNDKTSWVSVDFKGIFHLIVIGVRGGIIVHESELSSQFKDKTQ